MTDKQKFLPGMHQRIDPGPPNILIALLEKWTGTPLTEISADEFARLYDSLPAQDARGRRKTMEFKFGRYLLQNIGKAFEGLTIGTLIDRIVNPPLKIDKPVDVKIIKPFD